MKLLVAGGAGFIGSHFVRHVLQNGGHSVLNADALTYAGNLANLSDVESNPRYAFVRADIAEESAMHAVFARGVDAVINFAAETHVDRSIVDPLCFVRTNVVGTQTLLALAREFGVRRYLQVSTDEVYGSLGDDEEGAFTEQSPLDPSSPYSASKAAADLLVLAAHRTYRLDTVVTRCSNNYGSHQFPEKLIPHVVIKALRGERVPVYGDGLHVRDWLHVRDHCAALLLVLEKGAAGEVYNIGGSNEQTNIEIIKRILSTLGKEESLIEFVGDRPGHDRRYAIDAAKLRALGWCAAVEFGQGLTQTVHWYAQNRSWWEEILRDEYHTYYQDKGHS